MTFDRFIATLGDAHAKPILEFFIFFSRFEYALKEAGFVRPGRSNVAEPNWKAFANRMDALFQKDSDPDIASAIQYLEEKPPQRQVFLDHKLVWQDQNRDATYSKTEWLSVLIRAVRNNLFHGAKTAYDPARDLPLIANSLKILKHWVSLCPEVKQKIDVDE